MNVKNLKSDFPASIVVFFVALPLCLGIALASDAPPLSGLISGIIGGIVVGSLSGSKIGVSGPAAGLAAIVATSIATLGSFEAFLVAVVLAGIIQILFGILRMGIIGYFFPNSVITGMLAGIGIIIILKQLPHLFGFDLEPMGNDEFIIQKGENTFSLIRGIVNKFTLGTSIIGVSGLLFILFWDNILGKKYALFKLIQGPIVAVVVGTIIKLLFDSIPQLSIEKEHLVQIPVANNIQDYIRFLSFPNFSYLNQSDVWITAFTIALVASLETLLSVEATDKLDPNKNITPTNRELFSQGAGNIASGLVGGLPITQVIVRSSANVQSNAKSQSSTILHGLFLLLAVVLLPTILNHVPKSVLAAILILVGYKLAKPELFTKMWKLGLKQFVPFIVTILMIVFKDLLWGVIAGLSIGVFVVLVKSYQNAIFLHEEILNEKTHVKMRLAEEVTFLNKAVIQKELNELPENSYLQIDITQNRFMDYDVIEILQDFVTQSKNKNIDVTLIHEKGMIKNPDNYLIFFKSV